MWDSVKEKHATRSQELQTNHEQGLQAVHEAIKIVEVAASDPRSRIIACYQHLVSTVSGLGAPVSPNMTARELDRAVRSTFALKRPATTDLTQLEEEAGYRRQDITNGNTNNAKG